jgi:hypothetical protein
MLGSVLRTQSTPRVRSISSKLRDAMKLGLVRSDESGPPKSGDWFRASGLPKLCPRMYALAMRDAFSIGTEVDAELGWVFGIGTAIHTQFQEEFLRNLPEGVFQGWWRDRESGAVIKGDSLALGHNGQFLPHGWVPMPKTGGSDRYEYVELSFRSAEYRFTGHCDGILVWPDDGPEIFELKTINENGYAYVDPEHGGSPKAEHILQAQAYMWMSGIDRARIVYFCKKFGKIDDMVCEHIVHRDDKIIGMIQAMLKETIAALDSGVVPDRLVECRTKSSDRAKYCPAKASCFTPKKPS